ncbi:MAG: cytochrome c peroxidase [Acidobacteriota bacterium]
MKATTRLLALLTLLGSAGCTHPPIEAARSAPPPSLRREPIEPLIRPDDLEDDKVALGGRLFHDPILSGDGTVSCATCHDIAAGGDDGLPRSLGIGDAEGTINAPTVLNAGFNFVQFWDGRAETLEEQAEAPVTHPKEMGADWAEVVEKVRASPRYATEFGRLYSDGVTKDNIVDAIAEFERMLVTAGGPFDRWLRGDDDALSADARAGYELFQELGCIACHQGRNVGGNMYQHFGVMSDYFAERGDVTEADLGRFNVTGRESDKHLFRVPSLRMVAHTAPYFHDGTAETLPDAIRVMVRHQLGREIDDTSVHQLEQFLHSLAGPIPDVEAFRVQ